MTAGHRRDDADLVAGLDDGGGAGLLPHVGAVDEDVDEAADLAVVVADAFDQAGVAVAEVVEDFGDGAAGGGDAGLAVGCDGGARYLTTGLWEAD